MTFDRRRYFADNYVYLLAEGGDAVLVDPGDAAAARALCDAHRVRPRWILHTHAHPDHSGGSAELRTALGARVLGHAADAAWFAPDEDVAGRDVLRLGALAIRVHETPGHTPGSVLYEWQGRLLTGDTLFWGGAGNCRHGGDPARLAASFLGPIARLPGTLEVHPGHDYAERNLPFALAREPAAAGRIRARLDGARAALAAGREPDAPTLDDERAVNPFLRAPDVAAFVALRALRDAWTG